MNSIRRQLLIWLIGALLATGVLVSLLTYSLAWDAFNRLRDYGLEQIAYSIARHGVEYESEADEAAAAEMGQFASQIWNVDGTLAYSSLDVEGPPRQTRPGLHAIHWKGEEWHVYTLRDKGVTIQVGNPAARRARLFTQISPWLLLPMSVLVMGLGGIIWWTVSRALTPLDALRQEIGQQDVPCLSPLDTRHLPSEVAPLVHALNELLARLELALTTQRQFIADAAHELRTPLTAVRLQAQLARQAAGEVERSGALDQLMSGVDRASHLVEQLLQMARLEPDACRITLVPVSLDALARQTVADFSAQAEARGIDLGVGHCDSVTLNGHADTLRALLANLVDNALRYGNAHGRVDVEVHRLESGATLVVRDNGPGIPSSERERVFDRFHRLAGAHVIGSGLGLAIARRVAELHHGRIALEDSPGGGLTVRVTLPGPG